MRALSGAPTEQYYTGRYRAWDMFVSINNSKVYGYFHNLETMSSPNDSGDTSVNSCGITYSHAYSLLDTFQLKDANGNVVESFYVVRDPRGPLALTNYTRKWNVNDTTSWTPELRLGVSAKYGFDPLDRDFFLKTAIFLVAYKDMECFMRVVELWDRSAEGYSNDCYDVDGDYIWGEQYTFEVTVPEKKGDLYFNVESYYFNQI